MGELASERAMAEGRLWDIHGALSPSGKAFARAFDLAHAMVRELDGCICFWSSSMERLYGWSRAEALGRLSHDLLKTEFPKRLEDINAELLRVGYWDGELRHRGRDGRTIIVASHWALDQDQAGRPAWIIEINSDISAQKAAESRLRANTTELETILATAPAIIWIAHDVECRAITGSHASYELLRLPVGANPSLTAPDGERPVHFKVRADGQELAPEDLPVQRAARGETIRDVEVEVVFDDGTSSWIFGNAVPLLDDEGQPRGAVSAFVDVTERKEGEERYRRTTELLQRVMASISDYLWSGEMDEHGQWKYNYYSPVVEQITGRPPSYYMENPERWLETIHADDRAHCLRAFQRIATGKSEQELAEYRIVLPDGKIRWVRDSATVTHLGPHRFRVDGVVSDITDRKRAEASLQDSQTRLENLQSELLRVSRLTDMGQMAAALAHEINQPLASAANYLGACRLLLEKSSVDAHALTEARDRLALASDQVVRAGQIIRRIRNFIARGETERRLESARDVLEEACGLALAGVQRRGIVVRTTVNTSAQVLVDRVQIQQILVNLVRNAVDAMRDTPRKELTILVSEKDGMVETCVSDTGIGLPGEVTDRLFEPFASTKAEGMGLGLSVCRKIVEDHGGKIFTQHSPGGGMTFCFTMPVIQVSCHAS